MRRRAGPVKQSSARPGLPQGLEASLCRLPTQVTSYENGGVVHEVSPRLPKNVVNEVLVGLSVLVLRRTLPILPHVVPEDP